MPLLEEVDEASEGSWLGDAETLKANHRRKRASRARKKKKEDGGSGWGIFRVVFGAAIVIGFGNWAKSKAIASNSCKMTYSRPEFVNIPVTGYSNRGRKGKTGHDLPGYGYRLFRYVDGKLPSNERADPFKPTGTPVVFVPGHLGSYRQARSIGSHAAETKISSSRRRLDIFSLDLLEEASALHGSFVWRQAEFLNHAVQAVLALYGDGEKGSSVKSVMVVGHSLGGMVTRSAFTLSTYRLGSITDIVTLGTPHNRAPWGMDYSYLSLYHCTDSLWRWHASSPSRPSRCWSGLGDSNGYGNGSGDGDATAVTGGQIDEYAHGGGCLLEDHDTDDPDGDGESCLLSSTAGADASQPSLLEAAAVRGNGTGAGGGWGGPARVDAEGLLGNTVILGVSGGLKDLMVHPSLVVTDGLGLDGQSASVKTEVMEGCGFGVDHDALVWCKQPLGRVVAALSELERLHSNGAGAKERTRVATAVLAGSVSAPSRRSSLGLPSEDQFRGTKTGLQEATEKSDEFLMIARALASDRWLLIIPTWTYVACLVLAAALIRGLLAKSAKEGALPSIPSLLTPESHLHLSGMKRASRFVWTSIRGKGAAATFSFLLSCCIGVLWLFGDDISASFPSACERVHDLVRSVPGGALGVTAVRVLGRAASNALRMVNPFDGARDALRLHPVKGIMAVYISVTGTMMAFIYIVVGLGSVGNGVRRLLPAPRPVLRLLRSRKIVAGAVCAAAVAAHVETFSLPPTFREVTVKGELSLVLMALSISLHALLGSLVLFPSRLPGVVHYQHLLVLLYSPTPALVMGPHIAATDVLAGGALHNSFVTSTELALTSLALVPIVASVWLARRALPFPSPAGIHAFWAEFRERWAEEIARANGGSVGGDVGRQSSHDRGRTTTAAGLAAAAMERPNGHGSCGVCLHADGGPGAIYVETEKERVSIGAGVSLGPGFRVVACDCPKREPAAPSSWCEFCRCVCVVCGGCKEAAMAIREARARSRRGRDSAGVGVPRGVMDNELRTSSAVALLAVVVLYSGLWMFGMKFVATPCHSIGMLALMGALLCGMHWGLAKDANRGGSKS